MDKLKVVFHIDEMTKWKLTLGNVSNLLAALEDQSITIEVVANAEAVLAYVNKPNNAENLDKMDTLIQRKVLFVACNNALIAFQIDPISLFTKIQIVKAGVEELVIRQHEGYAYIKP
ncbi:MAG: hypothetical protein FD133_1282 [Erysipelotrichaceae bacterium]|nr:MAG: hypothetical protein FD179_184 [Erysipelotrichaceae bacterium]TXT17649.1 MAG: hypothetical protein FD133_1282 [Erysipelotrichaceae bacterium]